MKNQKGITLIALVITIIVLLILAGVAIAMLSGDNGILTNASESAKETSIAAAKEKVIMAINEGMTEYYKKSNVDNVTTTILTEVETQLEKLNTYNEDGTTIKYVKATPAVNENEETETDAVEAKDGKVTITYTGKEKVEVFGTVSAADGSFSWDTSADA